MLPVFGVTFAAFCIWLTVRIINRRERWAIWTVGAGLAYVASFLVLGCLCDNGILPDWYRDVAPVVYFPFLKLMEFMGFFDG